jgi:hypothetical protein
MEKPTSKDEIVSRPFPYFSSNVRIKSSFHDLVKNIKA